MRTTHWPQSRLALVAVLALVAGCGEAEDRATRFPASGTVLVDGQPAAGVQILLHPADRLGDLDALKPTAVTGADGAFQVGTYETGDGAPPGRYKVTLYWPDVPPNGSNSPVDLLGERFADPARSNLEATIKEGDNPLGPFEVKKAAAPPKARPSRESAKFDPDGLN